MPSMSISTAKPPIAMNDVEIHPSSRPIPPSRPDTNKDKSPVPARSSSAATNEISPAPAPRHEKSRPARGRLPTPSASAEKADGATISPIPTPRDEARPIRAASRGGLLTSWLIPPSDERMAPASEGRIKAAPVCRDAALKKDASGFVELQSVCFPEEEAARCAEKAPSVGARACGDRDVEETPLTIEQCDSGRSRNGLAEPPASKAPSFSVTEGTVVASSTPTVVTAASLATTKDPPLQVVRTDFVEGCVSESAASKASTHTIDHATEPSAVSDAFTNNLVRSNSSRQGRSLQRWLVHSSTDELVRQVAGTVPIASDGRIVLVSASRKAEWILPKGGWDADETREECAARETFEEAGLLGRLGGRLDPVDYEAKKARKRRSSASASGSDGESHRGGGGRVGDGRERSETNGDEAMRRPPFKRLKTETSASTSSAFPDVKSSTDMAGPSESGRDSPATAAFDPTDYSYVRLSLFPLYVTSVASDWPEKGRLRKLVSIDEAIRIMESQNRTYFLRGLKMVKERGLHLMKPECDTKPTSFNYC
ncbi:hypothetical protein ACHAWF_014957 [Thalassiosira exigua]